MAPLRFPTFVIIGAAKSGSTSLYYYLKQHPQIFMSPVKEPRFFALEGHALDFRGPGDERVREKTVTTLAAYQKLFEGVRDERVAGEASVIYLPHPDAAAAIARYVPDVKLIALLRDPSERAYSGFLYHTRDGYEPCAEFEDALRDEPRRIAEGWYYGWRYRDQGFYHRHLSRYYERFDARRIRVYLTADLEQAPQVVLAEIFRFLGVDDAFRVDVSVRWNPSGRVRNARFQRVLTRRHPLKEAVKKVIPEAWGHRIISWIQPMNLERRPMRPETRADLIEGYRDDIGRLEELIGKDLSAWRR